MNLFSVTPMSKLSTPMYGLIFCFLIWPFNSFSDMNIIGQWSGVDSDGDSAVFVFNEDQSAEVRLEGVPPLTSANIVNGKVEWFSQTDKDPMQLDFIIIKNSEEIGRIPIIAQFLDAQTLIIQMSRDMKSRPVSFELSESVFQIVTSRQ